MQQPGVAEKSRRKSSLITSTRRTVRFVLFEPSRGPRGTGNQCCLAGLGGSFRKGKKMARTTFKGALLATTIIGGAPFAAPAFAQSQTTPENVPPAPVTPTDTQGNVPPAAP